MPLLAAGLLACGGGAVRPRQLEFNPPRQGVFQDPAPLVETSDDDLLPTVAAEGTLIAYAAKSGGNLDIFVRSTRAGAAPARLTSHTSDDTDPAFSPDGERIAWIAQEDDVKGDVWVMDQDGGDRQRLTGRESADRAPAFSADGQRVYFASLVPGKVRERIDVVELDSGLRTTVVEHGWDPAPTPDGEYLLYVAPGEEHRPRLFALRLADGRTAALTDGAYIEGMPRPLRRAGGRLEILFSRFVDDQDDDATADADDPPSLWAVSFSPKVFSGEAPGTARPLTSGATREIFPAASASWLVYTTAGFADLDIYALPLSGMIAEGAGAAAVLEASRAADEPALRRLGLRHLVATVPDLEAQARYELARELAERQKLTDAVEELGRALAAKPDAELAAVSRIEIERLELLARLGGSLRAREAAERQFTKEQGAAIAALVTPEAPPAVRARADVAAAEIAFVLGERGKAVRAFEEVARRAEAPPEDAARALDRLGEIYESLGELDAVARVSAAQLSRFATERFYGRRAAERWVRTSEQASGLAPIAALEHILANNGELSAMAARAALRLGELLAEAGSLELAILRWREVVARYGAERQVVARALLLLGETEQRAGRTEAALDAFERLLADYSDDPQLRGRARRGLAEIALTAAAALERDGKKEEARQSYQRILKTDRSLVVAHRRYIALSADLGQLGSVLEEYRREAEDDPRDKLSRYGYGYALSHVLPLPLGDAEREVRAALRLDARLAAAHLTLGWLLERKEAEEPRHGHLEEAENSYVRVLKLVDAVSDPELYAAANLNRGNTLLALDKPDVAFAAYLERELSGVRWDSPLTELVFRESFARTAMRVDELDVALDMAHGALRLAASLGRRTAPLTALLAAIHLVVGNYADAERYYEQARAHYASQSDFARVVPLLRGRALAQQGQGNYDGALASFAELIGIVAAGDGPPEPESSIFALEIPGNLKDVTRGVHGFSGTQEEEIARAHAVRLLRLRGNLHEARRFDAQRLTLMREAVDGRIGARLKLELLHALNESALLAAHAGEPLEAVERFREALELAAEQKLPAPQATILASLHALARQVPAARQAVRELDIAAACKRALGHEPKPAARAALNRVLALWQLERAVQPPSAEVAKGSIEARLAFLEEAGAALAQAAKAAAASADGQLAAHIGALAGVPEGAESTADAGVADPKGDAGGTPAPDSKAAAKVTVSAPDPTSWRALYDRSLWDLAAGEAAPSPTWLTAAIAAFETQPVPTAAPERSAFLDAAAALLLGKGETERAWRLLERERLLTMQPPAARADASFAGAGWAAVRAARADAKAYAQKLSASSALVRALEAQPVALAALQTGLGKAALVQLFAPTGEQRHWFVLGAGGITHAAVARASGDALPDEIVAALEKQSPSLVYVDVGGLHAARSLRAGERALNDVYEVVEALSATYLVAAQEQRNLGRGASVVVDTAKAYRGAPPQGGPLLLHLSLRAKVSTPALGRSGMTQVTFAAPLESASFDLDLLARSAARPSLLVATQVPSSVGAARALALTALLAGIPTTIAGSYEGDAARFRAELEKHLVSQSPTAAFVAAQRADPGAKELRLLGDPGLPPEERVNFAFAQLLKMARPAIGAVEAARKERSPAAWASARTLLLGIADIYAYLQEPASLEILAKNPKLKDLPKGLPANTAKHQVTLAEAYERLGEVDTALALQQQSIAFFKGAGDKRAEYDGTLNLGAIYSRARRPKEAAEAYRACAALAPGLPAPKNPNQADPVTAEADCHKGLGGELRAAFDVDGAIAAYESAIQKYVAQSHKGEVEARRFLGYVYEGSRNDYARALEQFQAALEAARRHKLEGVVPSVLLDVARTFRQRGEYERAIDEVRAAEAALTPQNVRVRSEASLEAAKIYWYRGFYRRALERQREALELARRDQSVFLEIQAQSLAGLIALNQGDYTTAERAIVTALDLSRSTKRRAEEATQLNNLGNVLRDSGRLAEAIVRYREALKIDEELGSVEGKAYDLRNVAVALARQGDRRQALPMLEQALELSRSIGNRYNELQSLFARAEVLEAERRPEAAGVFDQTRQLARQLAVPEVEWRALYGLGRLAETRGELEAARQLLAEALAAAERLGRSRAETISGKNRDDLYDDAMRLAATAGDVGEVVAYAERWRGRGLLDILSAGDVALPEGAAAALAAVQAAGSEAQGELWTRFPLLARVFTIVPPKLADIQAVLPEGTLTVSFAVGRDAVTVLLVTRQRATVHRLSLGRAGLQKTVAELKARLELVAPVDEQLAGLGQALLQGPTAEALASAKHLVIVPHGALWHVPFAAVPVGGRALLEVLPVSRATSLASLYDQLRQEKPARLREVAAVAPAADLPFARLEAQAVAPGRALLGPSATEEAVRALAVQALDVAAHGELDARDPLASALVLSPGANDDGRLEVRELFALRTPELVTLSACHSGEGELSGDEWVGLAHAFLAAGSRTVIAAQGRVSDLSAAVLMKRFYRAAAQSSRAEALQKAALFVRQSYAHPSHWATFALWGDYR